MAACPPPQPPNRPPHGKKSVTRITSRVTIEEESTPPQGGGRGPSTPYYTPRQCPPTPRTGGPRGAPTPYYTPMQCPDSSRGGTSNRRRQIESTPYYTPQGWASTLRSYPRAGPTSSTSCRPTTPTSRAQTRGRPCPRRPTTPAAPPPSPVGSGRRCPPRTPNLGGPCPTDNLNATYTVDDWANATYTVPDMNATYTVDDGHNRTYSIPRGDETYSIDADSMWANASDTPCPHVSYQSEPPSEDDSLRGHVNFPSDYQNFSDVTTSSEADSTRAYADFPSDYQYLSSGSSGPCSPPAPTRRMHATWPPHGAGARRQGEPLATSSPLRLPPTQAWCDFTSPNSTQHQSPLETSSPSSFNRRWAAFADTPARTKRNLRSPQDVSLEFSSDYYQDISLPSTISDPPADWGWEHSGTIASCPSGSVRSFLDSSHEHEIMGTKKPPPMGCENRDAWSTSGSSSHPSGCYYDISSDLSSIPGLSDTSDWSTMSSEHDQSYHPPPKCPKGKTNRHK